MNPLLMLALGVGLLWLYSGPAYAKKTYPAIGSKVFPIAGGDRVLITAEMGSKTPGGWAVISQGFQPGSKDMNNYLMEQLTTGMAGKANLESLESTAIPDGAKFVAVIKYDVGLSLPLGEMIVPIAGSDGKMYQGYLVVISVKNLATGHELSL
jgi:hypothetical protein